MVLSSASIFEPLCNGSGIHDACTLAHIGKKRKGAPILSGCITRALRQSRTAIRMISGRRPIAGGEPGSNASDNEPLGSRRATETAGYSDLCDPDAHRACVLGVFAFSRLEVMAWMTR